MAESADADHEYAFGVLGPLRVTRAGVSLSLGGRQQRAVLARLLLADGAGLTVDQLADALWGADVPAGAASTIQTYVFHLRQVLEPDRGRGAPGQVVVTDQGRYRLAIAPDTLDSAAFERSVDRGERLLADGASAEAVSELDRALALWRGDVLTDLADYEFVIPVATRLADRRKAAIEAKIDAELALGRHASVLSQLNELVARDPLNERLHGQRISPSIGAGARPTLWRPMTSCATSWPTSSASTPARRCSNFTSRCWPTTRRWRGIRRALRPTRRPRRNRNRSHDPAPAVASPSSPTMAAHAVARYRRHPRGAGRGRHCGRRRRQPEAQAHAGRVTAEQHRNPRRRRSAARRRPGR